MRLVDWQGGWSAGVVRGVEVAMRAGAAVAMGAAEVARDWVAVARDPVWWDCVCDWVVCANEGSANEGSANEGSVSVVNAGDAGDGNADGAGGANGAGGDRGCPLNPKKCVSVYPESGGRRDRPLACCRLSVGRPGIFNPEVHRLNFQFKEHLVNLRKLRKIAYSDENRFLNICEKLSVSIASTTPRSYYS